MLLYISFLYFTLIIIVMKGINHKRYHFDHLSLNIIIAVDADTSPMSTTPVLLLNKFIYVIIVRN